MKYRILLTLLALFAAATHAPADTPASAPASEPATATLVIKAHDPNGNGVRCDVTLRGKPYRKTAPTDGDGVIVFVDVPPGDYDVLVDCRWRGSGQTHLTLKPNDFPIIVVTIP